jgi:hypothetical protein
MTVFTRSLSVADVGPCYAPALTTDELLITIPEGDTSITYEVTQPNVRTASNFAITICDGTAVLPQYKTADEAIAEGLRVGIKTIIDSTSYEVELQTDSRTSGTFCIRVTVINGG